MSPEQAEMSALGVDTRSDIYSLGVLLYELLTGSTPLDQKRVKEAAYAEIIRIIKEEEPPKPSTRLSESGEALASISAQRHTEPAKLSKLMRGELDWIVMKTLEKDRSRRYETANAFAVDVQRYLDDEPVQACPPSAWYRFGKFARRNKPLLVMASVIGLALLLAVGSLGWVVRDREGRHARTASEVNQFLQRAESLYSEYRLPESLAEVEKARGVLEAGDRDDELGQRVRQWLIDLETAAQFEALRRQHPDITDWDHVSADYARVFRQYGIDTEALSVEEAATRIAHSRIMYELTVALDTWAWRLQIAPRRGDPARWKRLRLIQRAADPDPWRQRLHRAADIGDLKTLREMADEADLARLHIRTVVLLGSTLTWSGDPEAGVTLLRRMQRRQPGNYLVNEVLGRCLTHLNPPPWEEVVEFRRVALALSPNSVSAHAALGVALEQTGRRGEAIALYHEAVRLKPKDPVAHRNLGQALHAEKKLDDAIACFKRAIELDSKNVVAYQYLGKALRDQNKLNEAIEAFREATRLDPSDAQGHGLLGWTLQMSQEFAKAEAEFREGVRLKPDFVSGHFGLGRALQQQKRSAEALAPLREAIRLDPNNSNVHGALGWALLEQKEFSEAEAAFREMVRLKPALAGGHCGLGRALVEQKKFAEAEIALRETIRLEPNHPWANQLLGRALLGQGKSGEAEELLKNKPEQRIDESEKDRKEPE
jgi:tetratricopeptide (TPR) repeat protein